MFDLCVCRPRYSRLENVFNHKLIYSQSLKEHVHGEVESYACIY